jgi:hypothetical protein
LKILIKVVVVVEREAPAQVHLTVVSVIAHHLEVIKLLEVPEQQLIS